MSRLNARQQTLYDAVMAANGPYAVETTTVYSHARATKNTGQAQYNAMASMVEPKGIWRYTPGGFARMVVLKLIEHQKIEQHYYDDRPEWLTVTERWMVDLIDRPVA